jgi:hypothetical protein
MRTTLTIDDDLAGLLQKRAGQQGQSFKEVVNAALRKGLAESLTAQKKHKVVVRPHNFGALRPGLDPNRMNQLVDELEVEDYLRKAAQDDSAGR